MWYAISVGLVFLVLAYLVYYWMQIKYRVFVMARKEHLARMAELKRREKLALWSNPDWKPSSYQEYRESLAINSKVS